ncbi:MAG: DEAD/DEAH box helicase, partial [Candidatus Velthaea sp.]
RMLQQDVKFKNLGLLVVDEEQRFGVMHKERLKEIKKDVDVLTMTATPIPRTLAQTRYADLDVSVIDELPPGRTPVETYVLRASRKAHAYQFVRKNVELGRQAYVVAPAIDASETALTSALAEAEDV